MRRPSVRLLTLAPVVTLGMALGSRHTGLLLSILMVGILITLHELGHFIAARWMKTPVDVFSIGFGPRLVGFQYRETDVRLSAIPLGGYVKLQGDVDEIGTQDASASEFLKQPFHKRMAFYSGGIVANILTTVVVFFALGIKQSRATAFHYESSPLLIMEVVKGSPAEAAGLKAGDTVQKLGTLAFPGASDKDAIAFIQVRSGQPIPLEVNRMGATLRLTATPKDTGGVGKLGISFQPTRITYDYRAFQVGDLWTGAKASVVGTWTMGVETLRAYGRLFTFRVSRSEVGGPISIVRSGGQVAQSGWIPFLFFAATLSMNLAILNALPIPGLDGSHMAMLTFEKIRGKDLSLQIKERILTTGFYLLLGLMAVVLTLDVLRLKG